MNEGVMEVLLYLFENYMDDELEDASTRSAVRNELEAAGFRKAEVNKAFGWLKDLAARKDTPVLNAMADATRVYADGECDRIPAECRGLLMHMEQLGILSPQARELVVDRVMALDADDELDVEQLKWIILMVLFNQPGQEAACAWMEDRVLNLQEGLLH